VQGQGFGKEGRGEDRGTVALKIGVPKGWVLDRNESSQSCVGQFCYEVDQL